MNNFVLLDITLILGCLVLFKELMQLLRNHIAKIHLKLLSAMEFLLLHHILTISAVNASICFEHLQIIPYPLLFDISFLYSVFKVLSLGMSFHSYLTVLSVIKNQFILTFNHW